MFTNSGPPSGQLTTPLLSSRSAYDSAIISSVAAAKDKKRIGFWAGVAFAVNYCIGVGILNIPSAFYKAGPVFGALITLVVSCIVLINILWVVETAARATALSRFMRAVSKMSPAAQEAPEGLASADSRRQHLGSEDLVDNSALALTHQLKSSLKKPEQQRDLANQVAMYPSLMSMRFDFEIPDDPMAKAEKTLEVNELLDLFCPFWVKYLYEFCLLIVLFLSLAAFVLVFGSSVAEKVPALPWEAAAQCNALNPTVNPWIQLLECDWAYRFSVIAFGIVVVAMSMREYTEMVGFQTLMTLARFVLIAMCVLVSILGIYFDPKDNHSNPDQSAPHFGNYQMMRIPGISQMVSACMFAQLMDFAVPEVVEPLKKKSQATSLFTVAILGTGFLYCLIGVTSVLYFGDQLESVGLNMILVDYTGGHEHPPWWALVVKYYVLLFPALDVLSMFPCVAISFGNSMVPIVLRVYKCFCSDAIVPIKMVRTVCRLAVSLPPILVQFVFKLELATITSYSSHALLFISCGMPLLLQYYSRKRCRQVGAPMHTPYLPKALAHEAVQAMMLLFCSVMFIVIILSQAGVI